MISQARKAQALTGILLLVVVGALTGSPMAIQVHEECIDGINNDGGNILTWDGIDMDGGVGGNPVNYGGSDGPDMNCLEYPWADGNGEDHTPHDERYNGDRYASTTFKVWNQYNNGCAVVDLAGLQVPDDGSQYEYQSQCAPIP